MRVGTVKEIKNHEYRVGLTPDSVRELVAHGHDVWVEDSAGQDIGASNEDYVAAGGVVKSTASDIFAECELVVKVKEPLAAERAQLRQGQTLFTFLHLAADPVQAAELVQSGASAIAYETVSGPHSSLPLLRPMSQVAGRMSIQAGAMALEKSAGGRGVLLAGVPGVLPAKVLVIGGGVVGFNAAQIAVGMGADVTILDNDLSVLSRIDEHFSGRARTLYANQSNLALQLASADLVIGAVLVPGAAAPKLVKRSMLSTMKQGAVLVDVAIDQGGCFETSKPTTHDAPTYEVDGIIHYCVANMPGAVARTSAYALSNVTLPYVLRMAEIGVEEVLRTDPDLAAGLNIHKGYVTNRFVAQDLGYNFTPYQEIL